MLLPLIAEPADLARLLKAPGLLIVDLSAPEQYRQAHVPGAVPLDYSALIAARLPVIGLIAEETQLSAVFSQLGLTAESHVVAYDSEGGGKSGRLIYTLHALGHEKCSWLNGGLPAWHAAGLPLESGVNTPRSTAYSAGFVGTAIADKGYIRARLGEPNFRLLDTRTPGEFSGADVRAAKGGHIPGAKNLDWTLAMDRSQGMRLKPVTELRTMLTERGIEPEHEVVVYCQTHHRSAHTYVWLKALGYNVKGYPGAWSDWGNDPATPVEI